MKKMVISALFFVSGHSFAMQDCNEGHKELMNSLKSRVSRLVGETSPFVDEIMSVYNTCLSRRTYPETLKDHLHLEFSHVELLRSLYESTAFHLRVDCEENAQIRVAHNGDTACASCRTEKVRATKLAQLSEAIQGQQDAIKKKMAIQFALYLMQLEPLEESLQQVETGRGVLENDFRTCPKLANKKS